MEAEGFLSSEGRQRKISTVFCAFRNRSVIYIRYISSSKKPPRRACAPINETCSTYQDSRVIGHAGLRMVVLFLVIGNLDVLHISPSKNDIIEFLARCGYEVLSLAPFGAKGIHVFKGDSRLLRIDVVELAKVADFALGNEVERLPLGEMVSTEPWQECFNVKRLPDQTVQIHLAMNRSRRSVSVWFLVIDCFWS